MWLFLPTSTILHASGLPATLLALPVAYLPSLKAQCTVNKTCS